MSATVQPAVLSYTAAAVYLGLPSVNALRHMVCRGQAPPSIKFGQRNRKFRVADIDEWLASKAPVGCTPKSPTPRRRGRPTKAETIPRRNQ